MSDTSESSERQKYTNIFHTKTLVLSKTFFEVLYFYTHSTIRLYKLLSLKKIEKKNEMRNNIHILKLRYCDNFF